MTKILRTHETQPENLAQKVCEEIVLLTRNTSCNECVEIILDVDLYCRLLVQSRDSNPLQFDASTSPPRMLGFKYRIDCDYGYGLPSGRMTVNVSTGVVFK